MMSATTKAIKCGEPHASTAASGSSRGCNHKLLGMELGDFLSLCLLSLTYTATVAYLNILSFQLTELFGVSQFMFGLAMAIPSIIPGSLFVPILRKVGILNNKAFLLAAALLVSLSTGLTAMSVTLRSFGLFFFASMLLGTLAAPCASISISTTVAGRCQVTNRVPTVMMVLNVCSSAISVGAHYFYNPLLLQETIGYDGALYIIASCNAAAFAVVWIFVFEEDTVKETEETKKEEGTERPRKPFSYSAAIRKLPIGIWYLAAMGLGLSFITQFLRFVPNYFETIGVPVEVSGDLLDPRSV